ncbi:MAG: hypothetical protein K2X01_12050 [Cyanobacteria bacterium]|nr:hypothetical protein [Cyanobacteriota bacterium]
MMSVHMPILAPISRTPVQFSGAFRKPLHDAVLPEQANFVSGAYRYYPTNTDGSQGDHLTRWQQSKARVEALEYHQPDPEFQFDSIGSSRAHFDSYSTATQSHRELEAEIRRIADA